MSSRLILLVAILASSVTSHLGLAAEAPAYFAKVTKAGLPETATSAELVFEVTEDSIAARAGLEVGDRIVACGGHRVYGCWESSYVREFKCHREEELELIVSRRGKIVDLLVEDVLSAQPLGYFASDDYQTWPQLLDDLHVPYEPADVTFLAYQSPRAAIELNDWLKADPSHKENVAWVKSFFLLRKQLANQEWAAAQSVAEKIPIPLFEQLADFYVEVAKRNAKGEQPPDPRAHAMERDFYVFAYPMPRYVLPDLGKFEPSLKSYGIWLKAHVQNHLQREPPVEAVELAKTEKQDSRFIAQYVQGLRNAIVSPIMQGGWPTRYEGNWYSATDFGRRPALIRDLEKMRDKHDADEPLYSFALAQLYGMQRLTKPMMDELESLWKLSPLLAYRAAVTNHYSLLGAGISMKDYVAMEDWRRAHLGPLAPMEPTFFNYVLERSRSLGSRPDVFERLPGDVTSVFYPGHLAIAIDHELPFREEFKAIDEAIKGREFAQHRRELLARIVKAIVPTVEPDDLSRLSQAVRDGRGSGLAIDAMLEVMEQSHDAPGRSYPMVLALSSFEDQVLLERPGEVDTGYVAVVRALKEVNWRDKPQALEKLKTLYEEHGRLAGLVEITKALRAQGWDDEAQAYEARMHRVIKVLLPRYHRHRGFDIYNLAAPLSGSPAVAVELDRLIRNYKEKSGENYALVTALHHVRTLSTLQQIDAAVDAVIESYSAPKNQQRAIYTFEETVGKSDDEYRRWLIAKLAAHKDFTAAHRTALLASPAGKDVDIEKILNK